MLKKDFPILSNRFTLKGHPRKIFRKLIYTTKLLQKPKYLLGSFVLGRFVFFRKALSQLYRQPIPSIPSKTPSLFGSLDIQQTVQRLQKDGFCSGLTLPEDLRQDILNFTQTHDCYAGGYTHLGFRIQDKRILEQRCQQTFYMADYFNMSKTCAAISKIVQDYKLKTVVDSYIGAPAHYTGCSLTWIFPVTTAPADTHRMESCSFHFDIDDYASLRVFFYLTDVTPETGPHVCVLGSHRKKSLTQTFNFFSRKQTDEAIYRLYPDHQIINICGPKGSGFFEDTFCFHKAMIPTNRPRLMLMLHFAANHYNNGKYSDYRDSKTLKSYV